MEKISITTSSGGRLSNISRINVLLGKNGSGKSLILRDIEKSNVGTVRYVVPERSGSLTYDPGLVQNVGQSTDWIRGQRQSNVADTFMQQAVAQFANMETQVLRKLEAAVRSGAAPTPIFDVYVVAVNGLLDNVELRRDASRFFTLHRKRDGSLAGVGELSSGERQLIALGMECLAFEIAAAGSTRDCFLLLDEPDVHIHPDLQMRLMKFVADISDRSGIRVIIATHSTAILGALESRTDSAVCFMAPAEKLLNFIPISESLRRVLPIFGAHPLSNIFNQLPLLLVEGADEERIWQQVVRTSAGRIRLYPCEAGGKDGMDQIEKESDKIIGAVYENGKGYSLRDRDNVIGEINDLGAIKRYRLGWRASENLILCDEVLAHWSTDWKSIKGRIKDWVSKNQGHVNRPTLKKFVDDNMPRETADLKEVRNIIASMIHGSKSWELLIGQAIGSIASPVNRDQMAPGSLREALGKEFFDEIFPATQPE